jgi:hypothetical protein
MSRRAVTRIVARVRAVAPGTFDVERFTAPFEGFELDLGPCR